MKRFLKDANMIVLGFILVMSFSCQDNSEEVVIDDKIIEPTDTTKVEIGEWQRVFTDEFDNSDSFNDWEKTSRFDYNSDLCQYDPTASTIQTQNGNSLLVLTATKSGAIWKSGHVKSKFSFKPNSNEEYQVSAKIKLVALKDADSVSFSTTYGAWPAFWTVEENGWPTKGEIDIFEGYSFGGTARFASNLFYGTSSGNNLLANKLEKKFVVTDGWHVYDENWKNEGGVVTLTILLDGEVKATYTSASHNQLVLENFGPHNIILNVNVGDKYGIFDNSKIDLFAKTIMCVDYVTVDKRTL